MRKHTITKTQLLIQDFHYPAEVMQSGKLQLSPEQAIEAFQNVIKAICRGTPIFWRQDALQELKLAILECYQITRNLKPNIVINRLKERYDKMRQFEYNSGARLTDEINEIQSNIYNVDNTGNKIRIHNHL